MQDQMRISMIIILLVSSFGMSRAQTAKQYMQAAKDALETSDYYTAYHFMQIVKDVKPKDLDVLYNYAQAARQFSAFTRADTAYTEVLERDERNKFPETAFWLGTVKQNLGQYQDALDLFQIYLSEHDGEDEVLTAAAAREIEKVQWAIEAGTELDSTIKVQRLGPNVNTIYSEFSPVRDKDNHLYFSSVRYRLEPADERLPRKYYSGVLKAEDITGEAISLDSIINNPARHTGHMVFSEVQERVYYTLCDYNETGDILCDLYYRNVLEDAKAGCPGKSMQEFIGTCQENQPQKRDD